jgi:hypothetical protein
MVVRFAKHTNHTASTSGIRPRNYKAVKYCKPTRLTIMRISRFSKYYREAGSAVEVLKSPKSVTKKADLQQRQLQLSIEG